MEKNAEQKKLKTAKGQIDGILKMMDEQRNCLDVSNQILATIAILKSVNTSILTNHLSSCVYPHEEQENKMEEVISIIKKLSK